MERLGSPRTGRIALVVMLIALVLTICIGVYLFLERRLSPLSRRIASGELTREALQAELTVLLVVLLGASLLIIVFVVGAYLLIRVGRSLSQNVVGGKPTEYVDVWSQARVTDDQIAAATDEHGGADDDADELPGDAGAPGPDGKDE